MLKKILTIATLVAAAGSATMVFAKEEKSIQPQNYTFSTLPTKLISEKGTLLLSDSPEYIDTTGGLVSAGTINGEGRVYYYHVNELAAPHKVGIVIENKSREDNYITVNRKLTGNPSSTYFKVGRDLSRKELEPVAKRPEVIVLPPSGRTLLFPELEAIEVKQDQLTSGLVDFITTGETFVRVLVIPKESTTVGASYSAPVLPIDEVRLRGTYLGAKRIMALETPFNSDIGPASFELANDRDDIYIVGEDELSHHERVRDMGNYGVSYTIMVPTIGKKSFDMYFNPLGGSYAGAIQVTAEGKSKIVDIPSRNKESMGNKTIYDTKYIGTFKAGKTLQINFMPAGASNLPVKILLIPNEEK